MANARTKVDPSVCVHAQQLADVAVEMASRLGHILDYSEPSLELVERILDKLSRAYESGELETARAWRLAKVWGSYLGEVFVRTRGGDWSHASMEGQGDGICVANRRVTFWPHVRAMRRVVDGEEANICEFYRTVTAVL